MNSPTLALLCAIALLGDAGAPVLVAQTAPAAPATPTAEKKADETPLSLPGSEALVYRTVNGVELRLHIVKPKGWSAADKRPAFVAYFGGGWSSGTPESSLRFAKWAANLGLVGIAPDYRTRTRFGGTPEDCVADARAALDWVAKHAAELGVDPAHLIAQGASAGGHLAAWTAIPTPGPGANDPAPSVRPAALVLINPVSDTKEGGYGGPRRFGNQPARALAASVPDQMPPTMPPTLIFHATGDATVPYANSVALRDRLVAAGNRCELVTFEGLGHAYYSSKFGEAGKAAYSKTNDDTRAFLASLGLVTAR